MPVVKTQRFKLEAMKKLEPPVYLEDAVDSSTVTQEAPVSPSEPIKSARKLNLSGSKKESSNPPAQVTKDAKKSNILSSRINDGRDARAICNTMKSLSALSVAVVKHGQDPELVVQTCERLAAVMTRKLGIEDGDPKASFAMPIMMEASSAIISRISEDGISSTEFGEKSSDLISLMMGAITKGVHRKIDKQWPTDIDASTSMHLVFASSMSAVAIEVALVCPFESRDAVLKRAGDAVMNSALTALEVGVSENCGNEARQTFLQSMISSAARIYAACWKSKMESVSAFINQSKSGIQSRTQEVRARENDIMSSIESKFSSIFSSTIQLSIDQTSQSRQKRSLN